MRGGSLAVTGSHSISLQATDLDVSERSTRRYLGLVRSRRSAARRRLRDIADRLALREVVPGTDSASIARARPRCRDLGFTPQTSRPFMNGPRHRRSTSCRRAGHGPFGSRRSPLRAPTGDHVTLDDRRRGRHRPGAGVRTGPKRRRREARAECSRPWLATCSPGGPASATAGRSGTVVRRPLRDRSTASPRRGARSDSRRRASGCTSRPALRSPTPPLRQVTCSWVTTAMSPASTPVWAARSAIAMASAALLLDPLSGGGVLT